MAATIAARPAALRFRFAFGAGAARDAAQGVYFVLYPGRDTPPDVRIALSRNGEQLHRVCARRRRTFNSMIGATKIAEDSWRDLGNGTPGHFARFGMKCHFSASQTFEANNAGRFATLGRMWVWGSRRRFSAVEAPERTPTTPRKPALVPA